MSAITPLPISDRILNPLKEVAQRQWTVLAARGILQTLVVSLGVLLAASLMLGFLPGMPMVLRVILAAGAWITAIWSAIHCLRPALQHWSLSLSAQKADSSLVDSEERISSAVELSQTEDQFRGSPELVAHLVKQAEQDASRVNASVVIPFGTVFLWALGFLPVLALWTILVLNPHTAQTILRGLFSTLMPWKNPPTVLADITVKPGDQILAQGDSLDVVATISATGKSINHANLIQNFSTGVNKSQNLEQLSGTKFSIGLENLQESFKYRVVTERGESPWYTVTVNPRPAIARLDVHLDYPKYTGLDAKTLTASDGNVDAVVGTKVTLTIKSSNPLVEGKSQLVFDDGKPTQTVVALTPTADKNVYQAKFDVAQSGEYHVKLLNEYNLGNKDDDARAVTARADEPPVITIQSPKEQITVRPDDEVSVMYLASDDFGVAHVDALVQVDDKPEFTMPVMIHAKNHKNFKDTWMLSVPGIVRQAGVGEATRISYQLKATDNRDPDPQNALSVRQTLLINKNEQKSFQDKLNEIRKEDLQAAIRKAIERLTQDDYKVAVLRDTVTRAALTADQVSSAGDVRDHITATSKGLSATASDYLDTPFADVAKEAKDIADKGIAQAADDTARVALDSSNQINAHADAEKAVKEIIEARTALEKLLEKAEQAEKKAEAAEALKEAAKKQEEVAKEMAQHPEKQQENLQKQQEAINKLNEALQKDPAIQDHQAAQLAKNLAELENKIEQEQQKQTDLQNDTAKQEEKQQAEQAANALAEEQKKLNDQVQQFAKDDKKAIDQAKAQTPDQAHQDQLVKNIEKDQLAQAAQEAQQQADQLKQDAQKLADQAKNPNADAAQQQQHQEQAKQDQQNAKDAAKADQNADQAAKNLQNEAKQDQPNANPDAAQKAADAAQQAAQQVEKAADKIEQANQQGAQNADVQKAADAAKADAQQAAQDAQAAAQAQNQQDAQKQDQQAAKELAKAGQELAQAAQAEAKADQAQAKADQAQAQQQNQQAAAAAADQAQALAQEQQKIAAALAQQAQQQADAQAAATPQQDAKAQEALAEQTQQAQQAAQALAQQAQAAQDPAVAQRAQDATKALDQAAQAQQDAAKADAAAQPDAAAQAQADAQKALAKADAALRGQPDQAQAQAGQPDPAQAQAQAGQPDQAQPGQGQPEQAQPGQGQPQQTAAQAAQEAAQAQQQALEPNPAAAAEAAQALAQAAQAADQALPGQGPPEQGQPGQEAGTEPGEHTGEHPHDGQSHEGISGTDSGGDNKPPAAVQALGINSSDWAKLPPLMQKELMNASQQSGPPAYKEMIKNYYIRVARMQNDHPDAGHKQ